MTEPGLSGLRENEPGELLGPIPEPVTFGHRVTRYKIKFRL